MSQKRAQVFARWAQRRYSFRADCAVSQATTTRDAEGARRRAIEGQLDRAKDLYLLGDFTREQYEAHKRVLHAELAMIELPIVADVADAAAALTNFTWFWDRETDPSERNKVLRLIFEQVTVGEDHIVSVTPRQAFLPYFQFGQDGGGKARERRGFDPRTTPHRNPDVT